MGDERPTVASRLYSIAKIDSDCFSRAKYGILASQTVRQAVGHCWSMYLRYRAFRTALPWTQVHFVSPSELTLATQKRFRSYSSSTSVLGGEWDRAGTLQFDDLATTRSIRKRMGQGAPWSDTDIYDHLRHRMREGEPSWGCTSDERISAHLGQIDRLYSSIVENGYRPRGTDGHGLGYNVTNEVSVAIGAAGGLIFADGRHRLAIAKLLDIEQIPVQIAVVHREWHQKHLQRLPTSPWWRFLYRLRCTTGSVSWGSLLD
jgi:hypothetical protein